MATKRQTTKQKERLMRDLKIKAVWDSMPEGSWKITDLARMFNCNVSSVWYAINGRAKKNGKGG